MKKYTYILIYLGFLSNSLLAQVKVGNSPLNIDPSAMLEVESTTKGFLPPRMTEAERDAIVQPAKGLIVYNTTADCLQTNIGTPAAPSWKCINEGTTAPTGALNSFCGGGGPGGTYPTVTDVATVQTYTAGVANGDLFMMGRGYIFNNSLYTNAPKVNSADKVWSVYEYAQATFIYGSVFDNKWPDGTVTDVDILKDGADFMAFIADNRVFFRNAPPGATASKFWEAIMPAGKTPKKVVVSSRFDGASGYYFYLNIINTDGTVLFKGFHHTTFHTADITLTASDILDIPDPVIDIRGGQGITVLWTATQTYYYGQGYQVQGVAAAGCVETATPNGTAKPTPIVNAIANGAIVQFVRTPMAGFFLYADGTIKYRGSLSANGLPHTSSLACPGLNTLNISIPAGEKVVEIAWTGHSNLAMRTDKGNVYTYISCAANTSVLREYFYKEKVSDVVKLVGSYNGATNYFALTSNGGLVAFDAAYSSSDQMLETPGYNTADATSGCSGFVTGGSEKFATGIYSQLVVASGGGNNINNMTGIVSPTLVPICK